MSVRHQHARQAKTMITKEIDGQLFFFFSGDTYNVDMTRVRYIANRVAQGKIEIDKTVKGILVMTDGIKQIEL